MDWKSSRIDVMKSSCFCSSGLEAELMVSVGLGWVYGWVVVEGAGSAVQFIGSVAFSTCQKSTNNS